MKWLVQIAGDAIDLEELSNSLKSPQFKLSQEEGAYVLEAADFDGMNDADTVSKHANEILALISGSAKLAIGTREPLRIAHVVRINDDGTRSIFSHLSEQVSVRGIPNILYLAKDGTVKEIRATDVIPDWLLAARRDAAVTKSFAFSGLAATIG